MSKETNFVRNGLIMIGTIILIIVVIALLANLIGG